MRWRQKGSDTNGDVIILVRLSYKGHCVLCKDVLSFVSGTGSAYTVIVINDLS